MEPIFEIGFIHQDQLQILYTFSKMKNTTVLGSIAKQV